MNAQDLQKELNVPVLLWGPLDERPDENGVRLRDTQCGLLQQVKSSEDSSVPFTYMTNCRLNDPVFERGLRDFMAVCNVVKNLPKHENPSDFHKTIRVLVHHVQRR